MQEVSLVGAVFGCVGRDLLRELLNLRLLHRQLQEHEQLCRLTNTTGVLPRPFQKSGPLCLISDSSLMWLMECN